MSVEDRKHNKHKNNINLIRDDTNNHKFIAQQCEHIQCHVCNSLIMRCNLNRHQETEICKTESL